jgi:hypothetical protein
MHFRKNYDVRQITQLLKENGIKTTIKEVRNMLQVASKRAPKTGDKSSE